MFCIRNAKKSGMIMAISYSPEGLLFETTYTGRSILFKNGVLKFKDGKLKIVPTKGTKLVRDPDMVIMPYEYIPSKKGKAGILEDVFYRKYQHMSY